MCPLEIFSGQETIQRKHKSILESIINISNVCDDKVVRFSARNRTSSP